MKRERLTKTLIICFIIVGGIVFLTSCGKGTTQTSATTKATDSNSTTMATTKETTSSVPVISGTLATNVIGVTPTWKETAIDPAKTMTVKVADFLRIRKGPGTDFGQVGSLTNAMTVTVVAKTDNNWYKLQDGYYVSGDFLTETP